jgi:hypothetical protein
MSKRLVMIHTVASLPETFGRLCDELLPGVQVEHVVDESLLQETLSEGELTEGVRARFSAHAADALAGSPDAVVLTCSSVGPPPMAPTCTGSTGRWPTAPSRAAAASASPPLSRPPSAPRPT